MYDFHIHSKNSSDSKQTLDDICVSAIEKGLEGIAVTDHVDMWFFEKMNTYESIKKSISDVSYAKEKYKDKIEIFQGIEMAEYLYDEKNALKTMNLTDYDVILGSIHSVFFEDWNDSYSRIDFSKESTSVKKINCFLKEYFSKMTEMAENTDFDILSHLTCPLRYINGKYKRNVTIDPFIEMIKAIFNIIIKKNISLELNTSGINGFYNEFMPEMNIMKLYYKMGGRMITLGSDAHEPSRIANGLKEGIDELKEIGFREYVYFNKRKPKAQAL